MSKVILVTGATGNQGGAVIDALIAQHDPDLTLLAVTRDAASPSAARLAAKSPSIRLLEGNLDDVPALFAAATAAAAPSPIWGVYSVQVSQGRGVTAAGEVAQGTALVDASLAHGVAHFVYSSVERGGDARSWDAPTPVPHFQTKHAIERHLRAAATTAAAADGVNMSWTVLRPVAFMDNLAPGFPTKVFLTALRDALAGKRMQWVAVEDVGVFAAMAFRRPEKWRNVAVGLAGDELTFDEMSGVFEKRTGSPAPTSYSVFGSALMYAVSEVRLMIGWFAEEGYRADVKTCREKWPGMMDFETWLVRRSKFETKDE